MTPEEQADKQEMERMQDEIKDLRGDILELEKEVKVWKDEAHNLRKILEAIYEMTRQ